MSDYITVSNVPSADVVEVVQCKDCKYNSDNGLDENGNTRCPIEEHFALPLDGYCHLGEKI